MLLTPGCNHSLECHPPSTLRPGGMTPATCDGKEANFGSLSLILTIPQWPSISRFQVGRTPENSLSISIRRDVTTAQLTNCERSNSSQACYDYPPHCILHWSKLEQNICLSVNQKCFGRGASARTRYACFVHCCTISRPNPIATRVKHVASDARYF